MVSSGFRLADVGTDHAYIPIYLVQNGTVPQAIAMDINRGPLLRAEENIRRYGLEAHIETRLSDGLEKLQAAEADTILIAGMGGLLVVRILENGRDVLKGCRELVLQPQSEIRSVRAWLEETGWKIDREDLIFEEGKYYPMLHAVPCQGARRHQPAEDADGTVLEHGDTQADGTDRTYGDAQTDGTDRADGGASTGPLQHELELRYGPLLLKMHHPLLPEYLAREERLCHQVLEAMKGKETEAAQTRRKELGQELELLQMARTVCES